VRSKALRISLIAYLLVWFGAIVPGHRRGIVTISSSQDCCDCCCHCADAKGTPPKNASHCAICDFAAHLTLPPVVDFTLPPLCLAERAPNPVVKDLVARIILTPYDGRGPPAAA
jgi:hypothetical protein